MKKLIQFLVEDWETSVLGIVIATTAFLVNKEVIDNETAIYIGSIAGSIGLILTKQSKKTKKKTK